MMETTFKQLIVELALTSLMTEIRLVNEYYGSSFTGTYDLNDTSGQAYIVDDKDKIPAGTITFENAIEAIRFPYRFTAPVFDILVEKYNLKPREEQGPSIVIEESEENQC